MAMVGRDNHNPLVAVRSGLNSIEELAEMCIAATNRSLILITHPELMARLVGLAKVDERGADWLVGEATDRIFLDRRIRTDVIVDRLRAAIGHETFGRFRIDEWATSGPARQRSPGHCGKEL